jgi:hypothetical protein
MKNLLLVLFVFVSVLSFGQSQTDTVQVNGHSHTDTVQVHKIHKSKKVELIQFDGKPIVGYITELKEDSISILSLRKSQSSVAIENIHYLKFKPKPGRRAKNACIGALIGTTPGVLIMVKASQAETFVETFFFAPIALVFGATVAVGGSILGGIIGYQIGKGKANITIPINGNQALYQKQKEKIRALAF